MVSYLVFLKKIFFLIGSVILTQNMLLAFEPCNYPPQVTLVIHNAPLAKVNGHIISLNDVIDKINLMVFSHNPNIQLADYEKYQLYTAQWQDTLKEIIQNQMILLDCAEMQIQVADGSIREELQNRFGNDLFSILTQMNMPYETVWKFIKEELMIQQVLGMKVHTKAFQEVTPEKIAQMYEQYLTDQQTQQEWTYQFLTIPITNPEEQAQYEARLAPLLDTPNLSLKTIQKELKRIKPNIQISLSQEYREIRANLSSQYLNILSNLSEERPISLPILQTRKGGKNKDILRIFNLKNIEHKTPKKFDEMYEELKQKIFFATFHQKKQDYIHHLEKKFGYSHYDPAFVMNETYVTFELLSTTTQIPNHFDQAE